LELCFDVMISAILDKAKKPVPVETNDDEWEEEVL
jgi:hypothetical protein